MTGVQTCALPILLGRVQRLTGLPAFVVYHLPRVLAAGALPALLAYLFGLCFPGRRETVRWAVLFALFTAGVLTLAPGLAIAARSGERIPESNIAYSFTVFPHFAVSYVGLTLAFTALAMALRGRPVRLVAATGVGAGVLLGLGHAFLLLPFVVVFSGVLVVAAALRVRGGGPSGGLTQLAAVMTVGISAAPFVFLLHRVQARLETLQGFSFSDAYLPDRWWTWALGFGVVSLLALAGAVAVFRTRSRDPLVWLLLAWIGAQLGFIYLPSAVFQRRFSEGLIVPIAGVAGVGAALIGGSARAARSVRGGLVAVLLLGVLTIGKNLGASGEYVPNELGDLAALVNRSDVVLAGAPVSAILPAISDGTAYAARLLETLQYAAKRSAATRYAVDPASAASRRWLAGEGITLVVVQAGDPSFALRALDDADAACLETTFRRGDLTAYRVQPECLSAAGGGGG